VNDVGQQQQQQQQQYEDDDEWTVLSVLVECQLDHHSCDVQWLVF